MFVDAEQLQGGLHPVVIYTVQGDGHIEATLRLRKDGVDVLPAVTLEGTKSDVTGLVQQLAQSIEAALHKLPAPEANRK